MVDWFEARKRVCICRRACVRKYLYPSASCVRRTSTAILFRVHKIIKNTITEDCKNIKKYQEKRQAQADQTHQPEVTDSGLVDLCWPLTHRKWRAPPVDVKTKGVALTAQTVVTLLIHHLKAVILIMKYNGHNADNYNVYGYGHHIDAIKLWIG